MTETTAPASEHLNRRQEAEAKTVFGFWVYLMTDCVLFATLFATFAILRSSTFGGPAGLRCFMAQKASRSPTGGVTAKL